MSWALIGMGVLGAPLLGGLLFGIDRKVTARLQGRKGPPIVQPFMTSLNCWPRIPPTLIGGRSSTCIPTCCGCWWPWLYS